MAERDLEDLFQAWRAEPVPPTLPASIDDRGGSAVVAAALRRVAEQKRRRGRVRRVAAALALAAGLSGVGLGAWYELSGGGHQAAALSAERQVLVNLQAGDVAVTDGVGHVVESVTALSEGYGIRTEKGSATLAFPSGASAKVAGKSSLKIMAAREKEALFLARGGVDVEVPKLDLSRGFSVETPDARVTVHGTRFTVLVEPTLEGPQTRVAVERGVVSVQPQAGPEVFLKAGQTWPPSEPAGGEPAAEANGGQELEDAEPDAAEGVSAARQGAGRRRPARAFEPRELADQNARFARAMSQKKQGHEAAALRELERLLRRYPGSPLTQEARVERLRLLRGLGRTTAAAREAKRYLREFPDGYATPEARELLAERP